MSHTTTTVGADTSDYRRMVRSLWSQGDYDRFATELIWEIGPVLVEAAKVSPGQRLLDVAAGTGNVALRAAEAGADVVAVDLTPEHFEAGRRHARDRGVEIRWVEGDAQALPFEAEEFDVVTSSFGAIFAPDHQRTAGELLRVCKPGGTIAMANFTPDGVGGAFFDMFARHAPPPPPGAGAPVLWGNPDYVRDLFGERLESVEMTRRHYVERAPNPGAYCAFFNETFGPLVALSHGLANQPTSKRNLEREFLEFAHRWNQGEPGGPAEYRYDYLLVLARKAD